MKLFITIFTFMFFVNLTYCQVTKTIDVKIYKNGDTSLWYKWRTELGEKLQLDKLVNSTDSLHFRFWQDGQAVDIWTNDYKTFKGTVTNYLKKYSKISSCKENTKHQKVYTNKIPLDTLQAREAYNLIIEYSLFTIPSEEKIKEWTKGKDGVTYLIEISTVNSYTFKSFWEPASQKNIVEAKKIVAFCK